MLPGGHFVHQTNLLFLLPIDNKKISASELIADAVALYTRQADSIESIEQLELRIEVMENLKTPEVSVIPGQNEKILEAALKFPGEEQKVNFRVGIEKSGNSINIEALAKTISKKLEKITIASSLLDNLSLDDIKQLSIPSLIANAVTLYTKQGKSVDVINKLGLNIEIREDVNFPEVSVSPGQTKDMLETKLRFPGKEQTIKFKINVPKLGSSINSEALIGNIKKKLRNASKTKSFLDKLAREETKKISLAEVIANAVVIYIDQTDEGSIKNLKLKVDIIKGLSFPVIDVRPGNNKDSLQSNVQFPGQVDKSLLFNIPVTMAEENMDQLIEDISNAFDSASDANEITNVSNVKFLFKALS